MLLLLLVLDVVAAEKIDRSIDRLLLSVVVPVFPLFIYFFGGRSPPIYDLYTTLPFRVHEIVFIQLCANKTTGIIGMFLKNTCVQHTTILLAAAAVVNTGQLMAVG